MPTVAISGGFDPIHGGHVDLIEEASLHGDVVVILNSDQWLVRKKGYKFMAWEQRAKVLRALEDVHNVISVDDMDGTVCSALKLLKPDFFANGGDRKVDNTPEIDLCRSLGIKLLFGIGGEKSESSSELVEKVMPYEMDW